MNPYSVLKVEVMKKRMRGLKLGMTLEQCRDTLGLDANRTIIGDAQESPGRVLLFLYPAEDHVIMILLDTSKDPAALLSVRVDEEVWPELNPSPEKKEPNQPSEPTAPSGRG